VSLSVPDSGSSSAVIAGMSAGVVLLFVTVAVAVIYYHHRKKNGKYNIHLIIQTVNMRLLCKNNLYKSVEVFICFLIDQSKKCVFFQAGGD